MPGVILSRGDWRNRPTRSSSRPWAGIHSKPFDPPIRHRTRWA